MSPVNRRWLWPVLMVAIVATMVGPGSSAAAQEDDFASIEVEIVGLVPWNERRPVNGSITVDTERAVSGTLSVAETPDGGTPTTYEFDLDLAAGTTAVFPVTFTTGWNGIQANVSIDSGGETVASEAVAISGQGATDDAVVATLGIDDPPRRVAEVGTELQLVTLPLGRDLAGLESASSLITTRTAMADLGQDSTGQLRLEAWIRGGGQLVVDGGTASLDDQYHQFPTANPQRFRYGAGTVLYAEEWESGIPVGGYLGSLGLQDLVESQNLGSGASAELSILAGVALPAALVIAGVLLIYSMIAGPLVFGVVSAKKIQRRIWVVLPALSLLFTVGLLGYGLLSRSGASEAHVTFVEVNDRGSRATSNLLLTSTLGDNRQLEAPEGWRYLGQGRSGAQRPARVRIGARAIELSLDMPPGANAQARFVGPASEFDGALVISNVTVGGGVVSAQVTNTSGHDLSQAVAFYGNSREAIGFLPDGETVPFTIEAFDTSGRTMKELLLWPRVEQRWGNDGPLAVPTDREAITAAGAWTEWRVGQGASFSPEGVVGVAAWSDEIESPVAGIDTGRTALFARANLPAGSSDTGYGAAVRLPSRQMEPIFIENFGGYAEDYRVTLDSGYNLEDMAFRINGQSAGFGLFIDGEWRFAELPDTGNVSVAIPEEAVVDGEIIMRSYVTDFGWGAGTTASIIRDRNRKALVVPFTAGLSIRAGAGGFDEQFFEEREAVEVPPTTVVDAEPPPQDPSTTAAEETVDPDEDATTTTTEAAGDEEGG